MIISSPLLPGFSRAGSTGQLSRMPLRVLQTLLFSLAVLLPPLLHAQATEPPRLVLQITVDQLRGDLLDRYRGKFGEGGFRYLLDTGTVFRDAHHAHANTETVVGHTTLATGAYPAIHGMIGNEWLDRELNRIHYSVEDDRYGLLTPGADVNQQTEVDPTQKAASGEGRSPAVLMVSTFSDELVLGTNGRAKVFAVSVKDRGAIPMAGHAGKAFWFSKTSGEFVTSSYYYSAYPEWVNAWNAQRLPSAYSDTAWELLGEPDQYVFGAQDDRPWEIDVVGFGRTFPHRFGPSDGKYFTTYLTFSPAGDALSAEFAKALIENEGLGLDDIPDYLSVSFSSVDYIGHAFGPSSLESEDGILRLDRTLADLLAFINRSVGLKRVLIVLSADHGSPDVPGYLQEKGIDAGYVNLASWDWAPVWSALKQHFGVDGKQLIQSYQHPYIYLDRKVLKQNHLDQAEVEQVVADELAKFPHVWAALSSSALRQGRAAATEFNRLVLNDLNAERSGDVYVVFAPNWFINGFGDVLVAATHGSPWAYDTFVPLIFAGPGVPAGQVYRAVQTIDLAPTLSAFLHIKMPSGASGKPLPEVLGE